MKKFLSLLLTLTLVFVLVACNNENTSSESDTSIATQTESIDNMEATDSDTTNESLSNTETPSNSNPTSTKTSKPTTSSKPTNTISAPTTSTSEPNSSNKDNMTSSKPSNTSSTPPHTHSFSDATCISPKKCSCGSTSGSALGHNFTSGVCSRCGTTDSNAIVWTYEDGGEDYIIKTNGKERIKITCNLGDLGIKDIPNDDYIVKRNIKRTHLKEYNGFVYFHLSYECSEEYVGSAAPSVGGTGAYSFGHGFYSLRLSDGNVKKIDSDDGSGLVYYMALGYDGDILYFIANHGYEPGGDIYSIDISQIGDAFIKNAEKCDRVIEEPSSSIIVNGILYLTYDEGETTTIAISELKTGNNNP